MISNFGRSGRPACGATSDAEGKFAILGVPCGVYDVVPFYADESTTFDVLPNFLKVEVKGGKSSLFSSNSFLFGSLNCRKYYFEHCLQSSGIFYSWKSCHCCR